MEIFRVLAADPGVTTGVAVVEYVQESYGYSFWQIDCRNLRAWDDFLRGINPDVILYEDFKHRPNLMKAELYSMQVIGVTRLYAERRNIEIPFTPIPSEAKAFWTDDKIKKLGLWRAGKNYEHAMDALRVYLTYKMKTDPFWFALMVDNLKD